MSATIHAVRCGVRRGVTEFTNSLKAPADVGYYVIGTVVLVIVLYLNRDNRIDEAGISVAALIFPGVLAMSVTFSALFGLATVVATEREDGTLLRCKSVPHGVQGYVWGQVVRTGLEAVFSLLLLLLPAVVIIPGLREVTLAEAVQVLTVLLLGLTACIALGMAIGSLFKNPRVVGGWGFLVMGGLILASGIFTPLAQMAGWVQALGQVFPLYWIGLGVRSALLPDSAVVVEIGQEWRVPETFAVLGGWAVVGVVLAPVLLRRMARRESGSSVQERRESALQRV